MLIKYKFHGPILSIKDRSYRVAYLNLIYLEYLALKLSLFLIVLLLADYLSNAVIVE